MPSNDAIVLSLVAPTPNGLKTVGHSFHPKFTYSIFGEAEEIFGYQNLQIQLRWHASDLRPNLSISYSKKFQAVGDTEPVDIEGALREFLPDSAFQKKSDWEKAMSNVPQDWTPPGKLIRTFTAPNGTFEVWKGNLADPAVAQLLNRVQILVPLFIEGGTKINTDEPDADRWTVFFLYQKKELTDSCCTNPYVFVGYCTVYRFFHFQPPSPPATPSETKLEEMDQVLRKGDFDLNLLPCRSRISQFLVIPPFQQRGIGARLYSIIFQDYIQHPQTVEITVEDPNEAFDDLRDVADLHYLRRMPEFRALHLNTGIVLSKNGPAPNNIVDKTAYDAVRAKAKITPRQFARLVEMHLMSQLPETVRPGIGVEEDNARGKGKAKVKMPTPEDKHAYRLWRLLVKKRLYKHNKDALSELDVEDRVQKLDDTVSSVEFDYARLLVKAEDQAENFEEILPAQPADGFKEKDKAVTNGSPATNGTGKRKADEDRAVEMASKRARVEDADDE